MSYNKSLIVISFSIHSQIVLLEHIKLMWYFKLDELTCQFNFNTFVQHLFIAILNLCVWKRLHQNCLKIVFKASFFKHDILSLRAQTLLRGVVAPWNHGVDNKVPQLHTTNTWVLRLRHPIIMDKNSLLYEHKNVSGCTSKI